LDYRVSWDADELCDDGNILAGDGCSASCAIESGWWCMYEIVRESWRDGDGVWRTLNGTDSTCYELIFCGNNARDPAEQVSFIHD
jgi:cysteine-rich repeat protein